MKKGLTITVLLLSLIILLVGCSGGGGSTSNGKVTSHFHVKDHNNNPIVGLFVVYTDPSGNQIVSPTTDTSGNATIITTKVGTYTVNYAQHNNIKYTFSSPPQFYNRQSDLDANLVTSYTITVNTTNGEISIVQN